MELGKVRRHRRRLACGWKVLALAVPLAVANLGGPAHAQSPLVVQEVETGGKSAVILVLPQGISPQERKRLIDDVTAGLGGGAALRPVAASGEASVGDRVGDDLEKIGSALRNSVRELPRVPSVFALVISRMSNTNELGAGFVATLIGLVTVFGGAVLAEWLWRRAVWKHRLAEGERRADLTSKLTASLLWLVREISGLAVFLATGLVVFFALFGDHEPARLAATAALGAAVAIRLVALLSRFIIAPVDSSRRMVPMSDHDARAVHYRILALLTYIGVAMLIQGLAIRFGASPQLVMSFGLFFGFVLLILWAVLIWQMRGPVARAILGGEGAETSRLGRVIARTWHFYVIGAFALIFLVAIRARAVGGGEAVAPQVFATLFLVILLPLVISASRQLLAESFERRRAAEDGETSGLLRQSLEAAVIQILALVWFMAAIFVIASMWGVDIFALESTGVGAVVFDAVFDIGAILIISYFLWVFGKAAIDLRLREEEPGDAVEAGEIGGAGATRSSTLLPLIRTTFLVVLVVMVIFVVLSELGVNIGPLIAGAGVMGLAIGFGAQTLVMDIISGVFFLIDDAFRRGEYIDVGSAKGTVERISVRSLQLRHQNGPLHTIPFGKIGALSNYSRDWAVIKFELRLPYETDINKVRKIIKNIGIDLLADETFGPDMLAPLKSQGVNRMDDSALIIRCKFMAVPGKQFLIRREAFTRIQQAFAQQGIKFAPRRVLVETSTPEATAQAAAAGVADGGEAEGAPA